ncbi:MAG: peptidase M20, partial [Acidobacteria bacterium]
MKRLICTVLLVCSSVYPSAQVRGPVDAYVAAHQQDIVRELVELLSIPNVAADRANIKRNADLLRALFQKRGFSVEMLETDGNPLV